MTKYRSRTARSKSSGYTFDWFGNNRHVCDVLSDMRKCLESLNFSALSGLIEEAQVMANRMEAALSDQKDLIKLNCELSKARKAYKTLQRQYDTLKEKVKPQSSNSSEKSEN